MQHTEHWFLTPTNHSNTNIMAPVYLGIIGVGGVGKCFLEILPKLPKSLQPNLVFVSRSTKNVFSQDYRPIEYSKTYGVLSSSQSPQLSLPEIASYLSKAPGPAILVDNTSNQDVANAYPLFLKQGISICTPNKKAFSGDLALFEDIFAAAEEGRSLVYHESSVGAGLPVISTLNELVMTGTKSRRSGASSRGRCRSCSIASTL